MREAAIISLIDAVVAAAVFALLGYLFFDVLGLILLIEGAVLLLIGGALGFAGQPGVRRLASYKGIPFGRREDYDGGAKKKDRVLDERESIRLNDVRAAFYMITGIILFLESFFLSVLLQ